MNKQTDRKVSIVVGLVLAALAWVALRLATEIPPALEESHSVPAHRPRSQSWDQESLYRYSPQRWGRCEVNAPYDAPHGTLRFCG